MPPNPSPSPHPDQVRRGGMLQQEEKMARTSSLNLGLSLAPTLSVTLSLSLTVSLAPAGGEDDRAAERLHLLHAARGQG